MDIFWNYTMLEIGWKSFGNRLPCLEVVETLSTPLVIFRSQWEFFRKSLKIIGKSLEVVGNLPRFSEIYLLKFRFCGDEKSHAFY